jgi:branched-chain amino acid transport system permease protein
MTVALSTEIAKHLAGRARWRPFEIAFWLIVGVTVVGLPERHLLLTQIAILGLFALSLDLILGFAGIISLGHAAFFGFGAYVAGLLAKHGLVAEPVVALLLAGIAAALLGWATSFLVLRGSDLTRLMVTLGLALVLREIANRLDWLTGGADGLSGVVVAPLLGWFELDMTGHVAYVYCVVVTFILFLLARRLIYSPFGLSLRALKENPLRASAIGIPARRRLVAIYAMAAGYAGIAGGLLAQTTQFASLSSLDFERSADVLLALIIGGVGYLYGGLIGAVVFKLMQEWLSGLTPQYWEFWLGLFLVLIVLVGREQLTAPLRVLRSLAARSMRAIVHARAGADLPAKGG